MSTWSRFRPAVDWIAGLGVTPDIPPTTEKHVRYCNLAAVVALLLPVFFLVLEKPLEVPPLAMALRAIGSLPFGLCLWMNARRHHTAARVFLIVWAIVFTLSLVLLYGSQSPTHLYILATVVATLTLFPEEERRLMWRSVGLCAMALAFTLFVREQENWWLVDLGPSTRQVAEVFVTAGAMVMMVVVGYVQRRTTQRAEAEVVEAREKADNLLLSIFPGPIAERLKTRRETIAERFEEVTVLFADLVEFTRMSRDMQPAEVVSLLDTMFSKFDDLAGRHGLEKIKTIGDAYMLVGGIHTRKGDHAEAVADMALDMIGVMSDHRGPNGEPLRFRIGVSSGPVVAGVIGDRKPSYDLWGDTVNTASRMESSGEPGRIQVSEATCRHLESRYELEPRGTVEVKGKGPMRCWFLKGRKS